MANELFRIPYLGCGIGLRGEIADETMAHKGEIQMLEVIAEHHFESRAKSHTFLNRFSEAFPIIPHGIRLSIGATPPIAPRVLTDMRSLTERLGAPYYSDHFTLTGHDDLTEIGHLSPLWYTSEMLEHVVRRVDEVQQHLGIPLVLENITRPFVIGEADYEEPEFIGEVCRRTGCGLLFDVTNLYINAYNEKTDPLALAARYPMESVVQLHLAGGVIDHEGRFLDSHSREVNGPNEGVWPVLEWTAAHAPVKALVIERDQDFGEDFGTSMLADLARARKIIEAGRSAQGLSSTPARR